ncbi:hypothetical protein [Pedomonas mirosovicensis]|uniref:hypothetical protein n=1 Tax=Pedomonas mirosovicensis TaxID=2908641 RepID=UPI0021695B87|nr:hypothetical protein [Pedomonas mirosovicensis]MCH8684075.1 hypothetical protein [Pedomonas mirosovicensis]
MSIIDLNNPPPDHKFKLAVEPEETNGERTVRLAKDLGLFFFAMALVAIIMWLCVDTLRSSASADEKKWAMSILTSAAGGIIGYLIRK